MQSYKTPASSRHASYQQQSRPPTISGRQMNSAQSGFLSYSASQRKAQPPRPLSLRPISTATSIAVDSDYESYCESVAKQQQQQKKPAAGQRYRPGNIREENEEEVSEAGSMDSLSSRARHMHGILSDTDSMRSHPRSSISSFTEAATPEASPLPHYGEPAIYDPDSKNPMSYRHSVSFMEDLPRYTPKDAAAAHKATTIGPRGPHLFRSLSMMSTNTMNNLASTADFIPPTPITPVDVTEFELPLPTPGIPTPGLQPHQYRLPDTPLGQSNWAQPQTPSEETHFNPERHIRPMSQLTEYVLQRYEEQKAETIEDWDTQRVCAHFLAVGFDKTIVDKFAQNDISGQILVDLKWEDLRELDIQSFGKRIELWSEIHHLRSRNSAAPVEQFATYRPESSMTRGVARSASHRSARPSPALSRPPMTPRTPGMEGLKAVAYNPGLLEEEEEDQSVAPLRPTRMTDSDDDGTAIVQTRPTRQPTRKRRVNSTKRTHVRMSRRFPGGGSVVSDANETTEGEQSVAISRTKSRSSRTPKKNRRPSYLNDVVVPSDSISVSGSRPKVCKAHGQHGDVCKKGDRCGKHRPKKLSNLSRSDSVGTILIATTPSLHGTMMPIDMRLSVPETRPVSMVPSSDVLGPVVSKEVKLQESALKGVVAMDPAENVKKFLIHQHVQHLEERRKSPPLQKQPQHDMYSSVDRWQMEPASPEHMGMPPISGFEDDEDHDTIGALAMAPAPPPPVVVEQQTLPPPQVRAASSYGPTSLDFRMAHNASAPPTSGTSWMRQNPRTGTPNSELDVPYVPEFRNMSSSVPPEMTYGTTNSTRARNTSLGSMDRPGQLLAPAPPPPPAAGISRRGAQTTTGVRPANNNFITTVTENDEWEEVPSPTHGVPTTPILPGGGKYLGTARSFASTTPLVAGGVASHMRVHSGWMRKRKTTWFRHEWPEHHFVLRGTRLGIHKDQYSAEEDFIEMDDYVVDCSKSTSTKLSAAFKSWKIKNGESGGGVGDGAFFFQLVPADKRDANGKRIAMGKDDRKVHHFAVKSREERIDWMRELMLAKAIKQKGAGVEVEINGTMI